MSEEHLQTKVRVLSGLSDVNRADWDQLNQNQNPFLSYDFLHQLEVHDCLNNQGWEPCHHLLYHEQRLIAALPLYIKHDSYGEFVFDWAWADALQRAGRSYYPKLVSAIPFSPVLGDRILLHSEITNKPSTIRQLLDSVIEYASKHTMSSCHILFCKQDLANIYDNNVFLPRLSWQYHWFNRDYSDFADFLSALNSKRRKQIRKERREVSQHDLQFEILSGDEITEQHWESFYRFYCSTFERKWGEPRFTLGFFQSLSETLANNVILIMAKKQQQYIAGVFAIRSADTLYGRHWGCTEHIDYLHFECCYYQTIEYCIDQGIKRLDAGIQGEHKIFRGFEPIKCHSYHWIQEQDFRHSIEAFLKHETGHIEQQIELLKRHIPYKLSV